MTCNFTSISTVFQSYQDDGLVIMKGCVQWNCVYGWKDFRFCGTQIRDSLIIRPALNLLSYRGSIMSGQWVDDNGTLFTVEKIFASSETWTQDH